MNRLGMIAVVSMMVGCATAPVASTPRVPEAPAQAEVRQRLDEIWDSAAKRNLNRLRSYHLYGRHQASRGPRLS